MEAIVLAGGMGTRLQKIVNDKPKSMALINGHPFLEYLFNYLTGQGITRVVLSVGYMKDIIKDHFKNKFRNIEVAYADEDEPLGTGGGIKKALSMINGDYSFALNGDSMFRIDLSSLHQNHIRFNADITIALRFMEETERYGTVTLDGDKRVTGFIEKGKNSGEGLINGGIYLIRKSYFDQFPEKFSLENDCFEKRFMNDRIFGYPYRGFFLDIGVPEDYMRAQDEFKRFED